MRFGELKLKRVVQRFSRGRGSPNFLTPGERGLAADKPQGNGGLAVAIPPQQHAVNSGRWQEKG